MNAVVDPEGPKFAVLASNPAPEGLRGGSCSTPDQVRLRYAPFPKTAGAAQMQNKAELVAACNDRARNTRQRMDP